MTTLLTTLRTFPWRRVVRIRWLIAVAVLLGVLGVGGLLGIRILRPVAPGQILPGQTLAAAISGAVARSTGVQYSTGAYLPGDRIVLYTRIEEVDLPRVRSWALVQLEPFAERLAAMPSGETLTWVIEYGPDPSKQEVLLVPLRRAGEPSAYTYVSASPMLVAQPTIVPTTAPPPPLNEPAPIPTAAPVAAAPTTARVVQEIVSPVALANAPDVATPLLVAGFDGVGRADTLWRSLAGDWVMADGVYTQRNTNGYDFLSLLDMPPLAHYSFEARLRLDDGTMGGGIIYNAPNLNSRNGAQIIDLDRAGAFLRWGHYDANGKYYYDGGAPLDPSLGDGQWHTLRVITHGTASSIWVDGREIAQINNRSPAGHVGLSASQARVSFDDVALVALPEGTAMPVPTANTAASLNDDFDDGNAKGWQVLSGTWQIQDGTYRQTSVSGADLSSISLFTGERYTATVRMMWLGGEMGAGMLFNMARRDTKARSQIVNYTQGGKALQWGYFDEGGNFFFQGSAEVPDGSDGAWHTLTLSVADGKLTIMLNDEVLANDIALTYAGGYVGLLANNGSVAFDDVQIAAK